MAHTLSKIDTEGLFFSKSAVLISNKIIPYVKNIKKGEYVVELVDICTLFIPGIFNELNFLFTIPTNALTDVYKQSFLSLLHVSVSLNVILRQLYTKS